MKTHTNSSLSELITSEPNKVKYSASFNAFNPIGADKFSFFVRDTSQVKVKVTAKLPMILSVFEYNYLDTFNLDSLVYEDTIKKYVEKAELKLIFNSQLPFNVDIQAFYIDDKDQIIGKVFDNGPYTVLANNDVNAAGVVRSVKETVVYVPIDQKKFNEIIDAKKIVVQGKASTSQAQLNTPRYVQIKSDYVFGIKAGLRATFKYQNPIIELK